jgi:hypothetical protein
MDQPNPLSPPLAASTPPTQPVQMVSEAPKPSWPTVIGVIGIVFSACAILTMIASFASKYFMPASLQPPDTKVRAMMKAVEAKWAPWTNTISIVAVIIAGQLLYASTILLKRRASAGRVVRLWAAIKIGFELIGMPVGYFIIEETMAVYSSNSPSPVPLGSAMALGGAIGAIFALIWGCSFPVFLLIWFSRRPVQEEMVRWS